MKKYLAIILSMLLILSLTACGNEEIPVDKNGSTDTNLSINPNTSTDTDTADKNISSQTMENTGTDWVIYWYLCGSDLESYQGSATSDLVEMMEVQLPEGVQVIIQTGGAKMWQNDIISADHIERYLYDSEGLSLIEQLPSANMGDPDVLTDFLTFAEENYPGDRTMINFWNHGGGSITGAAFDELFNSDSLTLDELYASFEAVYGEPSENYPVDIVGFDTCLMATIDTAYTFSNFANYLVASEELEPGNGWYYTGWLDAIAQHPTISPADLGVAICDTYVEGCEMIGTHESITLSVTDLSKLSPVLDAYEAFGLEALDYAVNVDTSIFNRMAETASNVENYGGNTREQGFTNMVDLGQLAYHMSEYTPNSTQDVIDAIDDAVVYKIDSVYRPDGMGLACYYPFDGDPNNLDMFKNVNPSISFFLYYIYGLTGYVDDTAMEYLNENLNYTEEALPELSNLSTVGSDWEDIPLTINEDGCATLTLGEYAYDALSSVTFELYYTSTDSEDNVLVSLGTDNNITGDWETGVFSENFTGYWGHIDGAPCYMEIVYEGEDYNEYSVPILLNDEEYNLSVIYDYLREEYIITGARKPIDESGAADKNIYILQEGDVIQPIHYFTYLDSDSDELNPITLDSITVTSETSFYDAFLGDGYYMLMFAMEDAQGNTSYSSIATLEVADEEVYTTVD